MSVTGSDILGLVRRYPYGVVCVIVTLACAAGIWYLRGENEAIHAVAQEKQRDGEKILALLVTGSTQRQELDRVREATRRIEENLLIETNLAENLWYFYKLEEQTRVRLPELHQLSSPPGDRQPLYKRIPYSLRVVGTHEQVAAFLQALETGPRLVNITAFTLARRGVEPGNASSGALSLDLNIELLGKR